MEPVDCKVECARLCARQKFKTKALLEYKGILNRHPSQADYYHAQLDKEASKRYPECEYEKASV